MGFIAAREELKGAKAAKRAEKAGRAD